MTQTLDSSTNYPAVLQRAQANMGKLAKAQPKIMSGFQVLHEGASQSGALDTKTKELIALAIAVAGGCDGCIAFHTNDALKAGANREEIMDALGVAVLMGGGPSTIYAGHVIDAMEQFQNQG